MAKPKKVDPLKAREKRAKIMVVVLLLVLVVVAAIMIPPVLKSQGPPPEDSAPPATTTVSLGTGAAPSTSVTPSTGSTATPSTSGELADTDVPPAPSNDQLVSFSVFQVKNPFAPQVDTVAANQPDTPGSTTGTTTPPTDGSGTTDTTSTDVPATPTTPTTTTPDSTGTGSVIPPSSGGSTTSPPSGTPTTTTPAAASAPGVTITVNGKASNAAAQGTFPTGSPVFRLVSFTKTSAQIGIVGGSYAAGGATLTLELGKPVTLENQTDGKRYTLELTKTR